jgi:hypothetical protein
MRGLLRIGLVAASVALGACNTCKPRRSSPHEPDAPHGSAAESHARVPPRNAAAPPVLPPARKPAVILAVDQSLSMQGFATTGAMTDVITDAEQAIRDVTHGTATYYSLGATAEKVEEDVLLTPARYTKAAADLRSALDVPDLRDSDVLVVFSDGQPTAANVPGAPLGPCTPGGTQVIADLDGWFASHVTAGSAVWILLEKVRFAGHFFLNCRDADKVPRIASHLGTRLKCNARECSYVIPKEQPENRALVGMVIAKAPFADTASKLVETYLRSHNDATAVRLHRSVHDRHTVDRVTASLIGARAAYPINVSAAAGEPATRTIRVQGPKGKPDMAVRVCVRLRAPAKLPGQPMAQLDSPAIAGAQSVGRGRTFEDWLELPRGTSLDPALMPRLYAARHTCPSLWPVYLDRADAGSHASGPSDCTGGDGFEVHELVTACGCLAKSTGPTKVRFEQGYHSAEDGVVRELSTKQLSADPQSWFEQPDRVNGLSELVHRLAAVPEAGADAAPHVVLRLVIDVNRP